MKFNRRCGLLPVCLFLFFAFGLYVPALAQGGGCTIGGTVRSASDNEPVAGATVYIDKTAWFARTDSEGRFFLRGITPGPLLLVVRQPDCIPAVRPINCTLDRPVTTDILLSKYVPPPVPFGSSRWSFRLRGGYSYYRMEHYNRIFHDHSHPAPTGRLEEVVGEPLRLGPGMELEGIVALNDRWRLGLSVGALYGSNSFVTDANFVGAFLHRYNQRFSATAFPMLATIYYNQRIDRYRVYVGLGAGWYPVLVRLTEKDTFRESGTITSKAILSGGGAGIHQVYGVEYFLGRKVALAFELKARLASVSGFTGIRKVSSARGEFEENVGLYLDHPNKEPGYNPSYLDPSVQEVMVLLPSEGLYLEAGRPKDAGIGFSGAQLVFGINFYL